MIHPLCSGKVMGRHRKLLLLEVILIIKAIKVVCELLTTSVDEAGQSQRTTQQDCSSNRPYVVEMLFLTQ